MAAERPVVHNWNACSKSDMVIRQFMRRCGSSKSRGSRCAGHSFSSMPAALLTALKESKIDGIGNGSVPGIVRVQVVAAVVGGQEP